jgi:hypothetical protein
MTYEWGNDDEFGEWLAAKESKKSIELIVSQVIRSESPIWQEWCVLWYGREYMGGRQECENVGQSERKIPSKKMGCWCCLMIKQYPHTEKILGKYEDEHDHAVGNDNL